MKLIYERSQAGRRASTIPDPGLPVPEVPEGLRRTEPPRLPELAEPELVRHWTAADRGAHEEMGFHAGWGQCAGQLAALVATL